MKTGHACFSHEEFLRHSRSQVRYSILTFNVKLKMFFFFKENAVTVSALLSQNCFTFLFIVRPDSYNDFAGFVPLCLSASVPLFL